MKYLRLVLLPLAMLLGWMSVVAAQEAPLKINGATTVNAQQIFDLITKKPNLVILDNRKEEDFAAGHIEGALRLLDTDVSAVSLAKFIPSKSTPVLFYCNGVKCGRAAKATEKAVEDGYSNVYYYALGMEEWSKERLPLVN
jgi:rhodanese-related sulfurtransferase